MWHFCSKDSLVMKNLQLEELGPGIVLFKNAIEIDQDLIIPYLFLYLSLKFKYAKYKHTRSKLFGYPKSNCK